MKTDKLIARLENNIQRSDGSPEYLIRRRDGACSFCCKPVTPEMYKSPKHLLIGAATGLCQGCIEFEEYGVAWDEHLASTTD